MTEDDERRSSTSLSPRSPRTSVQEDVGPVSPRSSKLPQVSEEEADRDECEQEDGEGEKKGERWKSTGFVLRFGWNTSNGIDKQILRNSLIIVLESLWKRFKNSMQLSWTVIGSLLDYLIGVLEDISREYREVSKILDKEKEVEKQKLLVCTRKIVQWK